VLMGRMETECW